jgi:hypothetical protein
VISITPLRLNFTDTETLERFKQGRFAMQRETGSGSQKS